MLLSIFQETDYLYFRFVMIYLENSLDDSNYERDKARKCFVLNLDRRE